MTARPSGAVCSPPSPMANAIGIMPAIIAQLVIRNGRLRWRAGGLDGGGDLLGDAAEIFSVNIGGDADQATHVVAIIFAGHLAGGNAGRVLNADRLALVALYHDELAQGLLRRQHLLRDFYLD